MLYDRLKASPNWLALAVLLAILGTIFYPALFGNQVLLPADILLSQPPWKQQKSFEPQNGLLSDQIEEFYPDRFLVKEAIRSGSLPLWNPFAAGGRPLLGNGQSAVFFPINFLSYVLPLSTALVWIAVIKLLIAGFSMYLFLRQMNRSCPSALLGGCSFMLSGFLIVWLNHPHTNSAIWLPLLFLLTDRFADHPNCKYVTMLSLVIALQFLGGHPETSLHVLAAAFAYVIFIGFTRRHEERKGATLRRVFGGFTVAVLLGSMLAAVQLLPLLEYLRESAALSSRTTQAFAFFSLPTPPSIENPL